MALEDKKQMTVQCALYPIIFPGQVQTTKCGGMRKKAGKRDNPGNSTEFSQYSLDCVVLVSHLFELLAVPFYYLFGHLGQEVVVVKTFGKQ